MLHAVVLAVAAAQPAAAVAPAPQAEGVISYPAAYFAAARPVVVFDMLPRLPGFSFDGGDTDVRGFGGAAGNVLVDGQRPASKGDTLEDLLRRMPASTVERIDVIRGGAPGIDMQGKPVVANVIRKSGDSWRGLVVLANRWVVEDGRLQPALRVEGSRNFDGKLWEGSIVGGGGIDDGAGDGPRQRLAPDGAILLRGDTKSEGDAWNVTGNTAYETPLLGGRLRANARLFYNMYQFDQEDFLPGDIREVEDYRETEHSGEVGLRQTQPLGPRNTVELFAIQRYKRLHANAEFDTPAFAADFDNYSRTGESIGRAVLKHTLSPTIALEGGVEGAFNWLEGRTRYAENDVPIAIPAANVKVEETRGEAFATATWRASPKLTLEAGLRAETSTITSEGDVELEKTLNFLKPRALATWTPAEGWQVRARVEREVGQLNFNDFVASQNLSAGAVLVGNPDLDPAQSWVFEAALERRFWTSGAIVLTARHMELKDVVDRVPIFTPGGDVFDAPGNLGEGTQQEIAVSLSLPLERLGVKGGLLRASSTWRRSEVIDPTTLEERRISGQHPVDWEIHFTQDLPAWNLNWGVDLYGGWRETRYRFDGIETVKLRPFLLPFVEYKPRPDITVRLEMPNAAGRPLIRHRKVYDGPRGANALLYTDSTYYEMSPMFYLRIRKTLGG
ncbi:MAG: TonB-dependent receptor [Caulobacteraceae bacterium]|nr:TonB-dependent receptor [Caulobacteraceae bacterium]